MAEVLGDEPSVSGLLTQPGCRSVAKRVRSDAFLKAGDLLRTCLRSCRDGAEVQIARIGGGHQWALRVALDAGLVISPGGGLVTRKVAAANAAYLPDNVFC